jgi:hypothetical protein
MNRRYISYWQIFICQIQTVSSTRNIFEIRVYFECSGFNSQLGSWLHKLNFFVIFLSPPKWTPSFWNRSNRSKNVISVSSYMNIVLSHLTPNNLRTWFFFSMARQHLGGLGRLIFRGFTITHFLDTPHSVGLLWTRVQLVAETSTWQHTTLTRDRHPCPRRNSNPQSQ